MSAKRTTLTCTLQDFAALSGRSLPTVRAWIRDGMPTLGRRGREHRVDVGQAVQWVIAHMEARAEEEIANVTGDPALVVARTRKVVAEAQLAETRLEREQGLVVKREQVIFEGAAYTKGWTAQVRGLPRRARQSGAVDTAEQEARLAELCRAILQDISQWKTTADADRAAI